MPGRPLQRLEATDGAADGDELTYAEPFHERSLRVDDVANRNERETHSIGAASEWVIGRRSGCALTTTQNVGADDERVVCIECQPRTDEGLPPATGAGRKTVAGQRVEDKDRVVTNRIQASPGAVRHGDGFDAPAELQIERPDLHREARGIKRRRRLATPADDPQPGSIAGLLLRLNRVWPLDHLLAVSHHDRYRAWSRSFTCQVSTEGRAGSQRHPSRGRGASSRRSLISQIALPDLAPCGQPTAGCRASQGRFPPPISIRQHSSVVDQESTE